MQEPQRTDSGRTEGEDSVSSVSWEIISGVVEATDSRPWIFISNFWGPFSIMDLLKVLSSLLGPISKCGHPLQSLEAPPFFYGPGLVSEVQAIWANLAPGQPLQNWVQGHFNCPHIPQAMGNKDQKWLKFKISRESSMIWKEPK
ncbi:hypothetical protein O181_020656 [Austropuccinia psidii MF-1]|uniref:Uncharacterized protein n=1 Tax=Austropuccinia psidii MF-1 TaxID=1389203 RepID=A0A9Q3GV11_9BASI|nr:hypothetical protein [Austropuccinia psidii MF-1]